MKKKLVFWSIVSLLIAGIGIFLAGWILSRALPVSAENAVLQMGPAEITPGGAATAELTMELPLFADAPEVTFQTPSGMVQSGKAKWQKHYRWNRNLWKMQQPFRALSPGSAAGGSASLTIAGKEPVVLQFPAVTVQNIPADGTELDLAGALTPEKTVPGWYGWIIAGVLMAAIGLLWWWKMRSSAKREMLLPPWTRAEQELGRLQKELEDGKTGLESGFLRLTDLLRSYLEERFQMPARKRTAEEFLEELRSDSNPLPPSEKPFLRDFLTAAELVKFAKQPPERSLLLRALTGAKELVIRTTPAEENKEGKNV